MKRIFFWLLFHFLKAIRPIGRLWPRKSSLGIVLIKIDLLGDFVLFSGLLKEVATGTHGKTVTLIANKAFKEYIDECPFVQRVIYFDKKKETNILYVLFFVTRMVLVRSDLVLNCNYSRTIYSDLIAYAFPVVKKIAHSAELTEDVRSLRIASKFKIYTDLVSTSVHAHETALHAAMANAVSGRLGHQAITPFLWSPNSYKVGGRVKGLFKRNSKKILICPDGSFKIKFYGYENFLSILNDLKLRSEEHLSPVDIFVVAVKRVEYFKEENFASHGFILHNLSGQTNLSELFYMIQHTDILIGNDTGPAHIALAWNKKAFVVHGGGHYGRFFPYPIGASLKGYAGVCDGYNCKWVCKYQTPKCIMDVKPKTISSDILEYLAYDPA